MGYLVYDQIGGSGAIIDSPLGSTKRFIHLIAANNLSLLYLINTHGHWDQTADNMVLLKATGSTLCAHVWDSARLANPTLTMEEGRTLPIAPSRADRNVYEGEVLEVGDLRLQVLHTPGHSPGSICLYEQTSGALFSGDTLLRMRIGRTDHAGGSTSNLGKSLMRLAELPDNTTVYPSHGLPTTIKAERWLLELTSSQLEQS